MRGGRRRATLAAVVSVVLVLPAGSDAIWMVGAP